MSARVFARLAMVAAVLGQSSNQCSEQAATAFTINYGRPLVAFESLIQGKGEALGLTPNVIAYADTLRDPSNTAIVKPNVDTLYATLAYDISRQDIVLNIPTVNGGRYYSAAFYTPYGDNYVNLGSLNSSPPGQYLLTLPSSAEQVGTLFTNVSSSYQGVVHSPSTFGIVLMRILLFNTTTDLDNVRQLVRGFTANLTSRADPASGPPLTPEIFNGTSTDAVEHILSLTSRFTQSDVQFPSPYKPQSAFDSLEEADIVNGSYSQPQCVNLTAASDTANAALAQYFQNPANKVNLTNNWSIWSSDKIGQYNGDFVARALIALGGYLALTDDQALYPTYGAKLSLRSNESYIFRFSSRPPLEPTGFWSLTMYNSLGFLVANPINRYALGDRSSLTFTNGTAVYEGEQDDGPFDILIQNAQPPSNWTNNWLPSPATNSSTENISFDALLRFYAPSEELRDGSWAYPTVTKQAAILDSNSSSQTPPEQVSESAAVSIVGASVPLSVLAALFVMAFAFVF